MAPSSKRKESEIRDHLAENLDLIEPGLTLINKELMLPNDKGAKGFLDIFCRTADGKYLIIEVKRSDAAARDAVQELVKYAALIKGKLLVKDTEVRLVAASSEWHELLVPFSEFVRVGPYDCQGLKLNLGCEGLTKTTEAIELAPTEGARRLSRRHALWGFSDEAMARVAVPVIADFMRKVGLKDFVLVMLAVNGHHDPAMRFLYFAQQELSLESYMTLIRARFSSEEATDFEEWIGDMAALEDKIGEAADKVWEERSEDESLYLLTHAIEVQIAYPEKARMWFAPEMLVSSEFMRFGRFTDPSISDATIQAEILGEDGPSFHHGDVTANLSFKTEVAALLRVADSLFDLNPVWRMAIHDLCAYAKETAADSVRMQAFSNEDILRTVAGVTIGYLGYAPSLSFEIHRGNNVEHVFGTIEWDGRKPVLDYIIKEYFEGDSFHYFMLHHLSGQRQLNADMMNELGLSFSIVRLGDNGPIPVRVRSYSIDDVRNQNRKFLAAFPDSNIDFVSQLVDLFLEHEQEFNQRYDFMAFSFVEHGLEEFRSPDSNVEPIYWSGEVETCDVCKRDMSKSRFMIDSAVRPGGLWACMCAACFAQAGGRIGWGSGQLYELDNQGWRLVGGECPRNEWDEFD